MAKLVRRLLDRAAGREGARLRARLDAALEVVIPDTEIQARLDAARAEAKRRKEARDA